MTQTKGQISQIGALLVGSAALLFAGGINALILPLRGSIEGFSELSLGLLGTGWAVGYVGGCLIVPGLVGRVGHIRGFSAMAGLAAISILASLLLIHAPAWIVLRAVAGFCFAGAAMIVESWLNERTAPHLRGRVFGIYTMVNLAATTAGQMLLTLGDPAGYAFFVLAAMFYAMALLPTAITRQSAPQPMVAAKLDLPTLWRNSPLAVAAVLLVGVSNSAFGTLGAVYGNRIGLETSTIAIFMSIAVVAGAALQVPVGWLSDRIDRRKVLLALTFVAAVADAIFVFLAPTQPMVVLVVASIFGAAVYAMYPVIVAHANDHAPENYFLLTSGGLLLLFGIGSIIGPLAAGVVMGAMGPSGLFLTSLVAHVALILFGLWRMRRRSAVPADQKGAFKASPLVATSTPQTLVLNPKGDITEPPSETGPAPENPAEGASENPDEGPVEKV
ncbi:MFS transporter [Halovulum dunhuangense]|uniref:MFS transporter n=1 Tax=Halovulum dunhuangense TaxID=1505036 RepID=A0A849L4Z1_9RHOB|nr:MFS transporter [Halovulum dunhuangense]NNU81426.1 MFS transporter [Halovulum dunhuangense]